MSNDFSVRKPKDFTTINVNEPGELLWCSYQLGITPERILSLVARYGNLVEQLKKHIKE